MILLADSGSTKCDWIILNSDHSMREEAFTMGFNPYFHSESFIATAIKQNKELMAVKDQVTHIYYYGAGCSAPELNVIVKRGLSHHFQSAEIIVDHDLLGAAYALYQGEPCICGILGTGSNSCFFDGTQIHEKVPALGYILGDEGSGSYFGKKLLAGYLYHQLPEEISQDFKKKYEPTLRDVVDNVYVKPHANVYLASFVRFISSHLEDPYIHKLLVAGMSEYLRTHVMCYENYRDVKLNLVGSVAYYFQDAIREAGKEFGIEVGHIVKKPIDRLVEYHKKYVLTDTEAS